MAATIDVHVDRDSTVFYTEGVCEDLEDLYALFRDVLLAPRLDTNDFERLRGVSLSLLTNELRGANDELLAKEALASSLWEGHPYGHPVAGRVSTLGRIDADTARAFRKQVFCQDRVTIGIVGDVNPDWKARMEDEFQALPRSCAPRNSLPPQPVLPGRRALLVQKPNAASTAISLGAPIDLARSDRDFPGVQLATGHLGLHRNSSGILYRELRELRGLNYGDYAYAEHFEAEIESRFARPNIPRRQQDFSIWIRPVKPENALFATRGALYFLNQLTKEPMADEALSQTRVFLSGYVQLETQTPTRQLGYAIDDLRSGIGQPHATYLPEAWKGLTPRQVMEALARHVSADRMQIAIVSRDAERLRDVITRNTRTPVTYGSPKSQAIRAVDEAIATFPWSIKPEEIQVVDVSRLFE